MSVAHRRPKQPEQLRAQLLAVALDLLVDEGFHALTLDGVARRAGVSKGGLQYHFRSKAALLEGLYLHLTDECFQQMGAVLADEDDRPGRHARAYIRTSFLPMDPRRQKAIGLLTLNWPEAGQRWRQDMLTELEKDRQEAPAAVDQLLALRLAADGFWCAQMFDSYAISEARRTALLNHLLNLCDEATR